MYGNLYLCQVKPISNFLKMNGLRGCDSYVDVLIIIATRLPHFKEQLQIVSNEKRCNLGFIRVFVDKTYNRGVTSFS